MSLIYQLQVPMANQVMSVVLLLVLLLPAQSLVTNISGAKKAVGSSTSSLASSRDLERNKEKAKLLKLLGRITPERSPKRTSALPVDPVLADPETKEPLVIQTRGILIGGERGGNGVPYQIQSSTNEYEGGTATFINLLEPKTPTENGESSLGRVRKELVAYIPPPFRSALATAGFLVGDDYVPMRDLFTSSTVSFAYERGWRQGFAQAGFPGADREFEMAREYFAPAVATAASNGVVVDMSCATGKRILSQVTSKLLLTPCLLTPLLMFTPLSFCLLSLSLASCGGCLSSGLFTRRFAAADEYDRVLGCDYSESMLVEARRRVRAEPSLSNLCKTRLDLVRLDVGRIPMRDGSVDAMHAGAAMHCWPDLDAAMSEIYRVLRPNGGRYFATTFLSSYFGTLQQAEGGQTGPSRQAFQYFQSVDQLRKLLEKGGFESDKIRIEVLGAACVVIRCEK